jgi:hypothetical protein
MSRVEIIVQYGMYTRELQWLRRWLAGLLYDKYGVLSKVTENDDYIIFEVENNVFELFDIFSELRIEMKLILRNIRADVKAFGVCSGDECVVVDNLRFDVALDDKTIRRLNKLVDRVMHVADVKAVEGIEVMIKGGWVVVYMGGCYTRLYANEAFVVGVDMVKFIEGVTGLKILGDVGFVYDVIEQPEPRSLELDFLVGEDGVMLFIDECSRELKFGEALRVAYWLMRLSLNMIETQKMIEGGL